MNIMRKSDAGSSTGGSTIENKVKYSIRDFSPRLYQQTILASASQKNTLIVLPTGLGKTNIFVMLAIQRLNQYPKSKVLLLGPTRPLIDQYKEVFLKNTNISKDEIEVFTGMVKPETRHKKWTSARIIFSTPQGLENDLISGKISLEDVSLLGFDEAHRAVGEYSYVWIAKQYEKNAKFERIVGMTASPGSDMETIKEVCANLGIEDVESRTDQDPDVKQYIKKVDIKWEAVQLSPEMKKIQAVLKLAYNKTLERLKAWDIINKKFVSRTDLIKMQGQLQSRVAQGEKDATIWMAISTVAQAMKIQHAIELVETQGLYSLKQYLEKLESDSKTTRVKAVKNFVADENFRTAIAMCRIYSDKGIQHPKLPRLLEIVKKRVTNEKERNDGYKMIIFSQFRDSGSRIKKELEKNGIKSSLFFGQAKKGNTGLSQKNQKEVIEKFKEGEFQVLISTSVGEEGLDIPAVDSVVFFEPVPSAIRTVQRRGRTGRQSKGEVVVLFTKGTRDENYRWTAHHKEKRMNSHLISLKNELMKVSEKKADASLNEFVDKKIVVHVDHREKGSGVIKRLIEMGAKIELTTLNIADYLVSSRVAIEFKTVEDFVSSILDGRLLAQLQNLQRSYKRPVVIIEGTQDIYSVRNVHPNAIRGMISTIMVGYGIPILQTKDPRETAAFIYSMARREQEDGRGEISVHPDKKSMTIREQQEYIVSALPGIGLTIARPLLSRFGSVEKVMTASEDELREVELVGKKKAADIRKLLEREYQKL